ncbi:hypothetical protein BWR18_12870 [Tateyamaria omphalii]|uniref:Uncharacterized protein n=1 Tax=Tateyamaria omphalii TaxID=299262 RepID=A0A1P8MWI6_9RHOB|nr:hypothetical protein BWR18_12870 [Tateyamaria omphalii]
MFGPVSPGTGVEMMLSVGSTTTLADHTHRLADGLQPTPPILTAALGLPRLTSAKAPLSTPWLRMACFICMGLIELRNRIRPTEWSIIRKAQLSGFAIG